MLYLPKVSSDLSTRTESAGEGGGEGEEAEGEEEACSRVGALASNTNVSGAKREKYLKRSRS
jgi:hypothetical protein